MTDLLKVYITFDNDYPKENTKKAKEFTKAVIKIGSLGWCGKNKNLEGSAHYPSFYNDRYYFHPHPTVLTRVTKEELDFVLKHFKDFNPKITHKYTLLAWHEVCEKVKGLENYRILNQMNPYETLFQSKDEVAL